MGRSTYILNKKRGKTMNLFEKLTSTKALCTFSAVLFFGFLSWKIQNLDTKVCFVLISLFFVTGFLEAVFSKTYIVKNGGVLLSDVESQNNCILGELSSLVVGEPSQDKLGIFVDLSGDLRIPEKNIPAFLRECEKVTSLDIYA